MLKNNKLFAVFHLSVILFAVYVCYLRFFRYLLADNETLAIAMLNPAQLPAAQPGLFSLLMILLIILVYGLVKLGGPVTSVFRIIKGLYGYSVVLIILQSLILIGQKQFPDDWNQSLLESKHLFVEVVTDETRLRAEPSIDSSIIMQVDSGTLLLLNDVKENEDYTWNRVLLAPHEYAWVVRHAKVDGDKDKRLSLTYKFHFTRADQMSFVIAAFGLLWGLISYKKRSG